MKTRELGWQADISVMVARTHFELPRAVSDTVTVDELRQMIRTEVRAAVQDLISPEPASVPLSLDAAATRLGVSVRTVRRLVERGKIRPLKLGGRVLVPQSQIDGLLRAAQKT